MAIHQPQSLFGKVIPLIETLQEPLVYAELPKNVGVIEKQSPADDDHVVKITDWNWKALLESGRPVRIPISNIHIHHKIVKEYGHDRYLVMNYLSSIKMPDGDTQLMFRIPSKFRGYKHWPVSACRAKRLSEYPHQIYACLTDEEAESYEDHVILNRWREAMYEGEGHD